MEARESENAKICRRRKANPRMLPLEALLGIRSVGALLGRLRGLFGRLQRLWAVLERSWAVLRLLGPSRGPLGTLSGRLAVLRRSGKVTRGAPGSAQGLSKSMFKMQ